MDQQTAAAAVFLIFFYQNVNLQSEVKSQIARKFLFDFVLKVNKLVKRPALPAPHTNLALAWS